MKFANVMDQATIRQVAMQAGLLVLAFGYEDGRAAIAAAVEHAINDGTWDMEAKGFPLKHMTQDAELNWKIASPELERHVLETVGAYLASDEGQAAVLSYLATTLRDLGPVGGSTSDAAERLRARFSPRPA